MLGVAERSPESQMHLACNCEAPQWMSNVDAFDAKQVENSHVEFEQVVAENCAVATLPVVVVQVEKND